MALAHFTTSSPTVEHTPPRVSDEELAADEIYAREDEIHELHEARVDATEIHKVLEKGGKVLGAQGKAKVSVADIDDDTIGTAACSIFEIRHKM